MRQIVQGQIVQGQIVQGMFADAVRQCKAGQLVEAEQRLLNILTIEPRHADSMNVLGLIACYGGRYNEAVEVLSRAVRLKRDNPSYHSNLGNALKAQGRIDDAAARYKHALVLKPDYAEAHNNLGIVLGEQGKHDDAVRHYERALALKPDYADAHGNLGITLAAQGKIAEAVSHYERALALNPDLADIHNNLGVALRAQGRIDEATAHYVRALYIKPDHAEAHNNLGTLLSERGRIDDAMAHYARALSVKPDYADAHNNLALAFQAHGKVDEAITHYGRAIAIRPDYAEAHNNLAVVLSEQGKLDNAVKHYERALVLKPGYADAHANLGIALAAQGRSDDAIAHCRQSLAANPNHAEAHNSLGNLCREQGRFDEALEHYGRAVAIRPEYAEAHLNRAEIKTFHPGDADLATLEALAGRNDLPANKALHIHFALAKAFEDSGDSVQAFDHLRKGNALKRGQIHYDETSVINFHRRVSAVFDSSLLDSFRGSGDPSSVPVFVLGMPRSGSSLIEQILASHPQIQGAGELTDLEMAAGRVLNAGRAHAQYPECVPALDCHTFRRMGEAYLARLPALADGKIRITDKLPGNFLHIGLIRLILPNARIIHTMRDPIDTCVSCYSRLFTSSQDFSYDLAEVGRYYRCYRELMTHWRTVLPPGAMLDVSYEDVVDDIEGQARRLIDYCGLPWDDRCIGFHRTSRPVRTGSAVQVRKPLFRSSLQRWRKYEADLGPLLRELGAFA